ncbi:MAG TPA: TadE/TadG family type IV pilus assembly protein [Rhizomicrobium sp.]|nr:TadE/TadG family type IV pilus assembly protein [Rhizomicrobium sp.]
MKRRLFAKRFGKDSRGVAAVEFAFIASAVGFVMLNVGDLALFFFDQLEVENATQMGAQAAYATCPFANLPATVNCSGLNTAITAAVQSTSLSTAATVVTGYPTEAYYCVNSSGVLTSVGAVSSAKPADCTAVGSSSTKPGDYLQVQVTFTYAPLFSGASIAALLPTTISNTAWVRLS